MIARQIIMDGLGGQDTKFKGFVWNFATFARLPICTIFH